MTKNPGFLASFWALVTLSIAYRGLGIPGLILHVHSQELRALLPWMAWPLWILSIAVGVTSTVQNVRLWLRSRAEARQVEANVS